MKKIYLLLFILLLAEATIFISCKKEIGIKGNKSPVAVAGPDQVVTLPTDVVLLDGSTSSDLDGTISSWLWTKISGPASFAISTSTTAKTIVKNLIAGTYQFELKVTDNGNLSTKDTVQISVIDPGLNRPPVANAGPDQTITLHNNSVSLDGSGSTDPDNNITSYLWRRISGPSIFYITNSFTAQTQVTNFVLGSYKFELIVIDAVGLFSKDTVEISVNADPPCDISNRPQVNAQLIQVGTLSESRSGLVSGAAGSKILFAGGRTVNARSSRVDIYDTITHTWSTAELTILARDGMAVVSAGNKILFAGGGANGGFFVTSRVDIYDVVTNTWSTAELSQARRYLAAAALGNKIYFAGGGKLGPLPGGPPPDTGPPGDYYVGSNVVDIYNYETNTWTTDSLSLGRFELSATAVGSKIYFAGGLQSIFSGSTRVDIFDSQTNTWSSSQLQEVKASHVGIAVNDKIFWASGANSPYWYGYNLSDQVEIKNVTTGVSTFDCIIPRTGFKAVLKNNYIVFFPGINDGQNHKFDIYNTTTNTWSIGVLPVNLNAVNLNGSAIISVNNTIYVAGGNVNGVLSNKVWKLEF